MESKPERKLRSKSPANADRDGLFNFDGAEDEISQDRKLTILPRVSIAFTDLANKEELDELKLKRQELQCMKLVVEPRHLEVVEGSQVQDPLSDELYAAYHRKMQKQEIRMVNHDKMQSETEAERLECILEDLDSENWFRTLLKNTVIQDPEDLEEVERKRDLTRTLITQMLSKFADMKSRAVYLARSSKHNGSQGRQTRVNNYRQLVFGQGDVEPSSDEDDDSMSISEIRARRKCIKERKYGGTIVIQLRKSLSVNYRYALVAEPLRSAYIVKCSKEEKEEWSRKAELLPPKIQFYDQFPKQSYCTRHSQPPSFSELSPNGSEIKNSKKRENSSLYTRVISSPPTKKRRPELNALYSKTRHHSFIQS
ncbi:LANO_0G08306g1_1 [Lachancea nothofagi CBS 11611]|uniref:LANO_0G08306g1_1 n=1 Tax=Lachancea nothofagi CBS 11611 TaxID=1266666 RepID=A0A1G4KHZ6_9SACH|nr:LANO_0G08306g1_1 [Lachancea nothofagi CBS 11611]